MKHHVTLTVASLLSIILMTIHVADDIARGMEPGGLFDLTVVPILVIWLYGTFVLPGRRSGYVIVFLGSLIGSLVPVIHFRGVGGVLSGALANSSGALFFVWTLIALGVAAVFSLILSVHGLWSVRGQKTK